MKVPEVCLVIMKGLKQNGLYMLQGSTVIRVVSSVSSLSVQKTKIWHQRLAHVSEQGLQELAKQGLLGEEKLDKLEFCEHYIYGKAASLKFNKVVHTTKGILNYVHLDL